MKKRAFSFQLKWVISIILIIGYIMSITIFNIPYPCIFNKLTNLYCPGCGNTRMIQSILEGKFYQAWRYNPLCFILIFPSCILGIDYIIKTIQKKDSILYKIPNKVWIILTIIVIIYGIIRNIPGFEYLRPTKI